MWAAATHKCVGSNSPVPAICLACVLNFNATMCSIGVCIKKEYTVLRNNNLEHIWIDYLIYYSGSVLPV